MVIQHTQRAIERIKERPPEERRALAGTIAVGVVVVLFIGWGAFLFRGLVAAPTATASAGEASTTAPSSSDAGTSDSQSAASAAGAAQSADGTIYLDQLKQALDQ